MKLYFDERSAAPKGWVAANKPQQAISYIQTGNVEVLNLQNDFSAERFGTAMNILDWIKLAILNYGLTPPKIKFHGNDDVTQHRLEIEALKIQNLYRIKGQQTRRVLY